mmetsp:Transcript_29168/g.41278  ORF Transcript_29168/g.41278 Transcript_29168/m.41278 type:complete len:80 (-) Transcript_29168:6-245(-)
MALRSGRVIVREQFDNVRRKSVVSKNNVTEKVQPQSQSGVADCYKSRTKCFPHPFPFAEALYAYDVHPPSSYTLHCIVV